MALKVGQIAWLSTKNAHSETVPFLQKVIVTKIGRNWAYYVHEGCSLESRFNIFTLDVESSFGSKKRIYLNQNEFWEGLVQERVWKALYSKLSKSTGSELSIEGIESVATILEVPVADEIEEIKKEIAICQRKSML